MKRFCLVVFALCATLGGFGSLADEEAVPSTPHNEVVESPELYVPQSDTQESTPIATNAVTPTPGPGPVTAPEVEPAAPETAVPSRRAGELKTAFKGAGSGRFGVSGKSRILKIANPAGAAEKMDKEAWRRKLELGLNTASGNSDILRYNAALAAEKKTDVQVYWLKLAGQFGESDGKTDTQNARGEASYERKFTERMYGAVDADAFHDEIADLAYRARGNVSLGLHVFWSDETVMNIELGPGYVQERKGGVTDGFMAARLVNYSELLVESRLLLWQSAEYVPSLEDAAVYYVNAEVGIETMLVQNLSLKIVLEDRYDSTPAKDKKNNDFLTTTSLNFAF